MKDACKPERSGWTLPFLEWRSDERDLQQLIDDALAGGNPEVAVLECAYHQGKYEESVALAENVIEKGDACSQLVARCLKLGAYIAMGDGPKAHSCYLAVHDACVEALKHEDDRFLFGTAVFCSRVIEEITGIFIEGLSYEEDYFDDIPTGLKSYHGFHMAIRLYRQDEPLQTLGMAKGFLMVTGGRYPIPCIKLHLLEAASYLRLGDVAAAEQAFTQAWDIAKPSGIVSPFVEMNMYIPGLTRRCLRESDERSYIELRALVRSHRAGFHALRSLCKRKLPSENLSNLEYYVVALAVWGWSNREIAQYLDVSENTVKHHLTSVYHKYGVKNRAAVNVFVRGTEGFLEPYKK